MKLSHGDTVIVTTGKDKGKKGTILRVLLEQNRVIVSGVNMVTKHVKKTSERAGQKVRFERSLSASNVAILDPKSGKATRIGYRIESNGKKIRIAKKSGVALERVKSEAKPEEKIVKQEEGAEKKPETPKSPFWKRTGATKASGDTEGKKTAEAITSATVTHTRSAGRGS